MRNGSFEEGGILPCTTGCAISGIAIEVGNSTAIPGWTVADAPVSVMGPNYFPACDGVNSLALSAAWGPGSVFQDLATEPGVAYDIGFDMAANPWNVETDSLDVFWGGRHVGDFTAISSGAYPDNEIAWHHHDILHVVATSETTRLQFVDTDSNNVAPLIDDVHVVLRAQAAEQR